MHRLLLRQLKRLGISDTGQPPTREQWAELLERVSRAYADADQDRYSLERSQEISSREMQELHDRLEEAQRIARLGNWSFVVATGHYHYSDQCYRIFGLDPAAAVPDYRAVLKRVHREDRRKLMHSVRAALHQGDYFEIECRVLRPGSELRWARIVGQPVLDGSNAVARVFGTVVNITRRKLDEERILTLNAQLERRVEERTRQLEAYTRDLESFSYSVSHDLRTPLRAIHGFAQLLKAEYGRELPDEAHDYLRRIMSAASRMSELIDGLLQLARVSRTRIRRDEVNLSQMACAIVAELRQLDPLRTVDVQITEGMRERGDPTLLQLALENLLSNAWKFTARQARPRIEFGRRVIDGDQVYFVRDNGAGFDMQYATKLFQAFQRLHPQHDYPGTGVGLATVHRVIRAHGGLIWAEAEAGRGATFRFTLHPGQGRAIG